MSAFSFVSFEGSEAVVSFASTIVATGVFSPASALRSDFASASAEFLLASVVFSVKSVESLFGSISFIIPIIPNYKKYIK